MQARGETWLAEGLQYIAGEKCPFCGQGLTGINLIQAYRSFFSREYHILRNEVTGLSGQVEGASETAWLRQYIKRFRRTTIVKNSGGNIAR
jgi:wobble nucleotide-excising tRNase